MHDVILEREQRTTARDVRVANECLHESNRSLRRNPSIPQAGHVCVDQSPQSIGRGVLSGNCFVCEGWMRTVADCFDERGPNFLDGRLSRLRGWLAGRRRVGPAIARENEASRAPSAMVRPEVAVGRVGNRRARRFDEAQFRRARASRQARRAATGPSRGARAVRAVV